MRPREAVEVREEGGEEGEEALVKGFRQREAVRDHGPKARLERGRCPQSRVVQVEAASQFEVLDRQSEQRRADNERNGELPNALHDEGASSPRLKGRHGRPPRQQKEEGHVPEADETAEHEHAEGQIGVADVVERRRIEDLADVEHEQEVNCQHAQPVDVGSPCRLHGFTPWRGR